MNKIDELKNIIEIANPDSKGRNKTLCDVLLAIGKKYPDTYSINTIGQFYCRFPKNTQPNAQWKSIAIGWNLKDDDLSKQSKETINFLYKLLCHKE